MRWPFFFSSMHSAPVRMTTLSRSRIARISCVTSSSATSSSSRGSSFGAFSTTVTFEPKRRYICANSRPM